MYFITFIFLLLSFYFVYKSRLAPPLKFSLLLALIIRLTITFIFYKSGSEDLNSFIDAGKVILERKPIYPTLYFPFFAYLGTLAVWLKNIFPQLIFLKLIFTLFDIGNLYLVYLISGKNLNKTLLYAVNPITIICCNIHGQFDVIPLFFLLLSVYFFNKQKTKFSMLAISLGIFTKTWPALFITPIFKKLKNKFWILLIGILPIVSVLFHWWYFKIPILEILMPIKNYRGIYGYWGIGNVLILLVPKIDASIIQFLRRVFFIVFFFYSFYPHNKNLIKNILSVMLFFFIFTLTFGSQWLAWLVPFIILVKPKNWQWFFITASIYLLVAFAKNVYPFPISVTHTFNILETIFGFSVWLAIISIFYEPRINH